MVRKLKILILFGNLLDLELKILDSILDLWNYNLYLLRCLVYMFVRECLRSFSLDVKVESSMTNCFLFMYFKLWKVVENL